MADPLMGEASDGVVDDVQEHLLNLISIPRQVVGCCVQVFWLQQHHANGTAIELMPDFVLDGVGLPLRPLVPRA